MKKSLIILSIFFLGTISLYSAVSIEELQVQLKSAPDAEKVNILLTISELFIKESLDSSLYYAEKALKLAKKQSNDSSEAAALNKIGNAYTEKGEYNSAVENYKKAIAIYEKIEDENGLSESFYKLGKVYWFTDDYTAALEYYQKALEIRRNLKNKKDIANTLNNIGLVYKNLGVFNKAQENYLEALKIYEEIGFKSGIAKSYNNIATIFYSQFNFEKALEFYEKALRIKTELGDKKDIANTMNNIGNMYYYSKKDYEIALDYYQKAFSLYEESENKTGMANTLNNIGNSYNELVNSFKAIQYFEKALRLYEETGNEQGIARTLINLAKSMIESHQYDKVEDYLNRSLNIAKESGNKSLMLDIYDAFTEYYKATGNDKKYLQNYVLGKQIQDTLFLEERQNKLAEMEVKYNYAKKETEVKLLKINSEKKSLAIYFSIAGLILITLLSVLLYNRYLLKKKSSDIIAEKNKNIVDSILYAEIIQKAMLPKAEIPRRLFDEFFILYKPKDIVSGDFYWFSKIEEFTFAAVVDCTGHGVPGAFMSMIGISLLNQVINEKRILDPARILETMNLGIRKELSQDSKEGTSQDGMDVCLCRIDHVKKVITFAGAKRSIFIFNKGYLEELNGERRSVGGGRKSENVKFTNHEIAYDSEELSLYLTTDGFIDQNNSEKRKFGKTKLLSAIKKNSDLSMEDQEVMLELELKRHQKEEPQRDDITIVGIRIR